ncbi:oxygen-insensitive NAD(P)H nitroreductase [Accumulibacter sp.]|uniref:oxygen-insensitive NAD(P)H nitroreductase n=1 Tax=Accumulibacter sp. TaxID=2053492 RepID=UPI00260AD8CC|nr:oxygen-insensitive NAD(P)H nitroreductase [Accumulibacter sp.]
MNLSQIVKARYTTKAYDPTRKIPAEQFAHLQTLLRYAPSSVNSQPWHFVIASTDKGKSRIAKATQPAYAYNEAKIKNASHVVVFCARQGIDEAHLQNLLAQEDKDGRFATPDARTGQHTTRSFYVNLHLYDNKDVQHWMEKQVYLSLGTLLLGAAALQIDATPIEGFDAKTLDEELGLRGQGLSSVVIACLGYRSSEDFNARLPKSRLQEESVITQI